MEKDGKNIKMENPESKVNLMSRLFFIWAIPFFKKLLKDSWIFSDIPVLPGDNAEFLGQKLEYFWEKELDSSKNKRQPILWNALFNIFGKKKMFYDFILFFNYVIMRPGLCILMAIVIRTFRAEYNVGARCIFGTVYILISLVIDITENLARYELNNIGIRMRAALLYLIYKKILRLNLESLEKTSTESILKIISNDLRKFQTVTSIGSQAVICLIQIVIIILVMWTIIGIPSIAGLLFIVIIVFPVNSVVCRIQKTQQFKIEASTDKRVNFIKEVMEEMRTIKINNWENSFENIIKLTRQSELKNLSKNLGNQLLVYIFFIHKFCSYLSVLCLYFQHNSLLPEYVIPCSQFLFMVLISTMYWVPKSLKSQSDASESLKSITKLLLLKEVKITDCIACDKPEIKLDRICFRWSIENQFDLRIENITIKKGSLCLVIGPSQAGKTTLLQLILSEVQPRCGTVEVRGLVSYCSQKPWLYGKTIRENIIFSKIYKETRYRNVVNICNLLPVFSQFMNEDISGLGPGGVHLIESQKSMINLARSIYQETDIYLIDDVLSLMDVEISKKTFDDCFNRYLARKTRVVVTNQIQFLDKADQIIVVNEGRAQIFDNLSQIKDSKIDLYSWMEDQNGRSKNKKLTSEYTKDKLKFKDSEECYDYPYQTEQCEMEFIKYIKSGKFFIIACFLFILSQASIACCDYWLAYWSSQYYFPEKQNTNISSLFTYQLPKKGYFYLDNKNNLKSNLLVHSSLIVITIPFIILLNGFLLNFFTSAAKKLHEDMSISILRAPMQFFNSYSMGKIYKLFTLDTEIVDKKFPEASQQTVGIYLFCLGCVILVYISEWVLIFSAVLIVPYIFLQKSNLEVSKIAKCLENSARYPILSHIRYTLEGVTVIRAYEAQRGSTHNFKKLVNKHTSFYRINLVCLFSFTMWSDLLCNVFLVFTIYGLILVHECVHPINPSFAGIAILQAYQLCEVLQYGSKKLILSAEGALSINRLIQYSNLPTESIKSFISLADCRKAPEKWPEDGVIEFKNVSLTYALRFQALNDVNFKIKRHEKIGVVGKTGSGKSSLISAIFNLHEFDGTILIDNVDTKLVALENLRKNISVIEEPVLFSESIAVNLDPIGEFSEEELWNVIEELNLKKFISTLCETVCSEKNMFSKGQILLLCLGRAILRKNKIIIFDEITNYLDEESEETFYRLVKKHFSNCTVIYITNSLNPAIMECDRVLVMEKGQIVDYDHPFSLLESEGAFYKLVTDAGKSVYSRYRHLAYQQYLAKFSCNGS